MKKLFPLLIVLAVASVVRAEAADVPAPAPAAAPTINGVEFTMTKGVPTEAMTKDSTTLKPEDFQALRKVETLKKVNFGRGIDDASLKILAGMPALESFTSNGMAITDAGIATMTTFPSLHEITCFHPCKEFTGAGLAALSSMPKLENLSVGGSSVFGNEAMKAISTLPHLKYLRIWHSGVTVEGVKSLANLKELTTLMLGQHLSMKPPATVDDESVSVLAGIPSLESINLQEAKLSLPALQKLKGLPNLKRLQLEHIEIAEADINSLKAAMPKVTIEWTAPRPDDMKRIDGIFNPAPPAPAPPPKKS